MKKTQNDLHFEDSHFIADLDVLTLSRQFATLQIYVLIIKIPFPGSSNLCCIVGSHP